MYGKLGLTVAGLLEGVDSWRRARTNNAGLFPPPTQTPAPFAKRTTPRGPGRRAPPNRVSGGTSRQPPFARLLESALRNLGLFSTDVSGISGSAGAHQLLPPSRFNEMWVASCNENGGSCPLIEVLALRTGTTNSGKAYFTVAVRQSPANAVDLKQAKETWWKRKTATLPERAFFKHADEACDGWNWWAM